MVRLRAHRNESLRGLQWQYKVQDKNRLHSRNRSIVSRAGSKDYINKSITARSIFLARIDLFAFNSLAFMGAQTNTLQWGCSLLYLLRSIGSLEQFGTRSRSSYERACWIGNFRFVFVFRFCSLMFVYQAKMVSPRHYTVDPMLLPSGNPFKCHEEVLYFQLLIPPKRFDIFSPDWGMLRRSRCIQIFL